MTEASGGIKRAEVERTLVQKSLEDDSFRQRLLDDPKAAVEQELGRGLPESTEVRVVQESADTIYLVLPPVSPVDQGVEISDEQLEAVAGGDSGHLTCNWTMHCTDCNGAPHPC
jgi:Nitrile hydratase, alpha chain